MLSQHLLTLFAILAAAGISFQLGKTATANAATNRVFEIRTYTAEPGKLEALHARFRDHTVDIFKKHGMTSVGYFAPSDEPLSKNTLIYVLAFPSREPPRNPGMNSGTIPSSRRLPRNRKPTGSSSPKWIQSSPSQPTIHP